MAFKLTKDEETRRSQFVDELRELAGKLEDALRTYNAECEKLRDPLQGAVNAYNEKIEEARGFAEDIGNRAEEEISNKSEKWQEGERGEAAAEWKSEWENADFDTFEIEYPEALEEEAPDDATTIEELPVESD